MPTVSAAARQRYAGSVWRDELLDAQLDAAAAAAGARTAIVDGARRLSYREMHDNVVRLSDALRRHGVTAGDVVSFQLPNWWEATTIHYAIIRLGAVSNPLVPIMRERELRFILRQAASKILFVPGQYRHFEYADLAVELRDEIDSLHTVVVVRGEHARAPTLEAFVDGDAEREVPEPSPADGAQDAEHPAPGRSADDPVLLLYTSGTESQPKGVVHSHNTLAYENDTMAEQFALSERDCIFMPSPVTHISGLLYGIHLPVALQTTVALLDQWQPRHGLELVTREQCTFTVGATPFLSGLVDVAAQDGRTDVPLRYFVCGGADVPPPLIRAADEQLHCVAVRAYGSTEFPTLCAGGPRDTLQRRSMTDGRILGAAEARVMTQTRTPAASGTVGELQVRGPEGFLGYLDDALNVATVDADGWISTGDQAIIDADGYVSITGRTKDIILRGGENISAKEVEDLLIEHPDVREVAVVAMPDEVLTEKACAFVVPQPATTVELAGLVEYLDAHHIARQKFPERLELIDSLPKTASGKVRKVVLRQRIRAKLASERGAVHDPAA